MTHDTWTDRLSEYVDGELDAATLRALELHLSGCADCRGIADQLRQLASRARALPALPPRADLWPGIQTRIQEARVLPLRQPARTRMAPAWPRLAAAGLLISLVSGAAVYAMTRTPTPASSVAATANVVAPAGSTTAQYAGAQVTQSTAGAVADLEMILQSRGLDSTTVRIVTLNLARIDSAIADAERALAADPSNIYVSRHLASTARRRVELLHLVAGLTQSRS